MLQTIRQSKAQIILLSNFELRFFVWEKKQLRFVSRLTDSPQGHAAFEKLQTSYAAYPAIIITNFIEESFRHDSVPPVSGRDLRQLLERKLEFSFRKSNYRTARLVEKQKSGRRDLKILLSSISKPELLRPWVKTLLDNKTPVQSITSIAYLAEAFARSSGMGNEEHLLIITLENNSELRQSYLRNGRLLFSRLTALTAQNTGQLGAEIYKETLQIRNYLERVKLLPYEGLLRIRIYTSYDEEALQINHRSNTLNSIECVNIRQQLENFSLDLQNTKPGASLLMLCHLLQKKPLANIYAPFPVQKYHQLKLLSSGLTWLAAAFLLVSISISLPAVSDALDTRDLQQTLQARAQPLLSEYAELSQRFPETPIQSQQMALVVSTYENIAAQAPNPTAAMTMLAAALQSAPDLQITEIGWRMLGIPADPRAQQLYSRPANAEEALLHAILEQRTRLQLSVRGIAFSPSSYREAQNQVLNFSRALESQPGVMRVNLQQMPTDVRLDTAVTTTVDGNALRAPFVLEIILAGVADIIEEDI